MKTFFLIKLPSARIGGNPSAAAPPSRPFPHPLPENGVPPNHHPTEF